MNLFQTLGVASSGLTAQRQRAEILVENLANSETTRTAEGGPYRRRDVVFSSSPVESDFSSAFQGAMDAMGVQVDQVVVDDSAPEQRYMPGHPDADANGYVAFPNINATEEMADLLNASRSYQANISTVSAVKDMILRSIDILK